ncbi:MAG: flagellar hook basal-body protein [Acidobacteria bacterium]|nr:flagellar hook basal-body protein [Acidobacteriota bacterium]
MDPGYYVAAGSLAARSLQLEVLANNLANAGTVGYKRELSFFTIFNKTQAFGAGARSFSRDLNDGTLLAQKGLDMTQGAAKFTGANLDLAIEGDAFFVLQTPQGTRVTRDGRFTLGKDGLLQALDGSPVLGKNGQPIRLDPSKPQVNVGADGSISQGTTNQDQESMGQLELKAYANPGSLPRAGVLRFEPAGQTEVPPRATVSQGHLEQSSVDVPAALVEMIRVNRLFEMSLKVASTLSNDLDSRAINDIAGLR